MHNLASVLLLSIHDYENLEGRLEAFGLLQYIVKKVQRVPLKRPPFLVNTTAISHRVGKIGTCWLCVNLFGVTLVRWQQI